MTSILHLSRRHWPLFALAVLSVTPCDAAAFDPLDSRNALVEADLIAEVDSVVPGEPFIVAVRLRMKETWHVNWYNPGDAGLAPGIEWRLPEGFSAGMIQWPHPQRYEIGPLVIFGYADEVLLLSEITPPETLSLGSAVELAASTSWLACQQACVPGEADVRLNLPVGGSAPPSSYAPAFKQARNSVPVASSAWRFLARIENDDFIRVEVTAARDADRLTGEVFFFPEQPGVIENAAPQQLSAVAPGPGYQLMLERNRMERLAPDRLTGVFVVQGASALRVDIPLRR